MQAKRGKSGGKTITPRPRLIALSDPLRAPDPFMIARTLPLGAWLIWRAYEVTPTREEITRLTRLVHARKGKLLIAGASRLTALTDGMHLPAHRLKGTYTDQFRTTPHRPRTGFQVTAAAHNEHDIIAAARVGINAVLISPVFATASHPGARTLGPVRFASLAQRATKLGLEVIALGGMTGPAQWHRLKGSAAIGLAGISLFNPR